MSEGTTGQWEAAKLKDVCEIVRGLAFPTTDKTFTPSDGTIACLRTTNVQREVEWDDLWFIPEKHVRHEAQLVRFGDILISTANSFELVGKVAQVKNLPYLATLGAFISLIRPNDRLNKSFVFYQLTTSAIQSEIRGMASTTTNISNVSTGKLRDLQIHIAPLEEQSRVVDEIEKQFTRLDMATAALKRVQANLKRYRASVLKAACEGRLVPTEAELAHKEGRAYESADKLLQRILRERRARWEADTLAKLRASGKPPKNDHWKQKYKEPSAPDTSGLPPLPEGWCWASLEQLTSLITSGSRGWGDSYAEIGPLFVRAQDIKSDSLKLDSVAHVDLPSDSEGTRTRIFQNDVLVTITGANVTKTAIVTLDIEEAYVSQHVGLVRPILSETAVYLYSWIISPSQGRRELLRLAYGAGKPGLNLENLRTLLVALPPVEEQVRLENQKARMLSSAVAAESTIQQQIVKAIRTRSGILQHAFTGQLVPQDPTDEPASALLERIRAERARSGGIKHVRSVKQRRIS